MKNLESFLITFLAALIIVGLYSIVFGVGVGVLVWVWNTLLAVRLGLPTVSFLTGVCIAIVLGFVRTSLKLLLGNSNEPRDS